MKSSPWLLHDATQFQQPKHSVASHSSGFSGWAAAGQDRVHFWQLLQAAGSLTRRSSGRAATRPSIPPRGQR